jgi:hypothetical protein
VLVSFPHTKDEDEDEDTHTHTRIATSATNVALTAPSRARYNVIRTFARARDTSRDVSAQSCRTASPVGDTCGAYVAISAVQYDSMGV